MLDTRTGSRGRFGSREVIPRIRPTAAELVQDDQPSIAYGSVGVDPPTLLLIHGLGARWQVFAPLMRYLQEDCSLVACDLRGHGETDRTPGQYALADFSDDIIRFIEATAQGPIDIYGHSLGGWIAIEVASRRPDLVRSMIIADTAIYPDSLDPELAISYLSDLPMALRSMAKSLNQLDPDVMDHFHGGTMLADFAPDAQLDAVTCPTTLLQGDPACGALMTDGDVRRARIRLERFDHVRLDGVGHGLHVEDTPSVSDVIRGAFGLDGS